MAAPIAVTIVIARRRGYGGLGGRSVVRCRRGHLFSTIWIPGVSIKSIRLGWYRLQRCPVGAHWSLVRLISGARLSPAEKTFAYEHRDWPVP
ncbi:MAG: hypothetical protein ACYCPT_03135 [Acidimicrobiales bacterium]